MSVRRSRNVSSTAVSGSGISSMSDSWIAWKPRIDEPSNPNPSSNDSTVTSEVGIVKCWTWPGRSQKRRSTNSYPPSSSIFTTSLADGMAGLPFVHEWTHRSNPDEFRRGCRCVNAVFQVPSASSQSGRPSVPCRPEVIMDKQTEYVLRTVEERGIRFIRLWFTDVLGYLKSFAITPAELETAFEEGMQFDGSAIDGFSRVQEADMLAHPDPKTFQILPWRDDHAGVARMFCDLSTPDEHPFEGDHIGRA